VVVEGGLERACLLGGAGDAVGEPPPAGFVEPDRPVCRGSAGTGGTQGEPASAKTGLAPGASAASKASSVAAIARRSSSIASGSLKWIGM
jgi:hypothetical protein